MRTDDLAAPLAEEVLREPERHRHVEAIANELRQVEDVALDELRLDAQPRKQLPRLLEHECRRVEERDARAALTVEERVQPPAGAELHHLEPVEPAEALADEALLRVPPGSSRLPVDDRRIERLDAPLRVPVGCPFHRATVAERLPILAPC